MDSINSSKMTASSILLDSGNKSKTSEKVDLKSIDTKDSFVKSGETQTENKLDFVRKPALDVRDGKAFLSGVTASSLLGMVTGAIVGGVGGSPLLGAGISAAAGGLIGGAIAGSSAVERANAKLFDDMPILQHSVEYGTPITSSKSLVLGQIPTDYYVSGPVDKPKKTPLKDIKETVNNPVLGENGEPKLQAKVERSEGKGTPNVSWANHDISVTTPTMTNYSEYVSENCHYDKIFSHYETTQEKYFQGYDGYGHPIYKYKTIEKPIFNEVKVVDGFNHTFTPNITTKTEKVGEYKTPTIHWAQTSPELDEAALILRDALIGAGLGAASGAITGGALAFAFPKIL